MAGPVLFGIGVILAAAGAAMAFLPVPPLPLPPEISDEMVMWAALGSGGGLTIVGALLWMFVPAGKRKAKPGEPSVDVDTAMMLRAIFSVAAADGELGETEVEMIGLVTEKILERRMARSAIKSAFAEFAASGETNVTNPAFDDAHSILTPESAYAALKAATLVALSDGDLTATERASLTALAQRLGLPPEKLEACIADASAAYGAVAG